MSDNDAPSFLGNPRKAASSETEPPAAHPHWLRVGNFCVALFGAFFLVSFLFSFVLFMNAREDANRESVGSYHASTFRVLQSYWQKGRTSKDTRASARGLVEGKEEWMDLREYLGMMPKDEQTVLTALPPGKLIPVFYNPTATGYYRVLVQRSTLPPADASRRQQSAAVKYGLTSLSITGLLLAGALGLRKMCL